MSLVSALVAGGLRACIRAYQLTLSPLLGAMCRFEPSCSRYFDEAIHVHGPLQGLWLGVRRLSRCHPLGGHGHDPVPERIPRGTRFGS
jgi:putative membrane protein insertion efficiency factor